MALDRQDRAVQALAMNHRSIEGCDLAPRILQLELDLREMRSRINELHAIAGPGGLESSRIELIDRAYINFIATLQEIRGSLQR